MEFETQSQSSDGNNQNIEDRYGVSSNRFKSYVPGPKIRLVAVMLGICLVPLQLLCSSTLQNFEIFRIILPMQKWRETHLTNNFGNDFINIATYGFKFNVWLVIMQWLNFFTDSLITYKVVLTTCFGCFWIVFMKVIFTDSRPFWDNYEVSTYGICTYEYPSPNIQGFFICFSCVYIYMQYRKIYS